MPVNIIPSVTASRENLWMTIPLRITLGIIFFAHGSQKLFGWFGGHGLSATAETFAAHFHLTPGILWAGLDALGEFFGAILVFLGFFTRIGALLISVIMLVATVQVHRGLFFLLAGMEFPLALLGSALALLIAGGGRLSLDRLLQDKWPKMTPERRTVNAMP
jgi:putative oxidoreductase